METFLREFKAFAMRGNVIDLAVAVVIGTAFGKIVSSLVNNIIMPLAGALIGGVNLSSLSFSIGAATISYGVFLQSIVDFVIIALAIFVAIKFVNEFATKKEKGEKGKVSVPSEEIVLLREIRDSLRK